MGRGLGRGFGAGAGIPFFAGGGVPSPVGGAGDDWSCMRVKQVTRESKINRIILCNMAWGAQIYIVWIRVFQLSRKSPPTKINDYDMAIAT